MIAFFHRLISFFSVSQHEEVLSPEERARVERAWDAIFANLERRKGKPNEQPVS